MGRTQPSSEQPFSTPSIGAPALPLDWVAGALLLYGLGFFLFADAQADLLTRQRLLIFVVALYGAAALLWGCARYQAKPGPWCAVVLIFLLIHAGLHWLALPGLILLVTLPTAIAALLIGLRMGGAIALVETWLLMRGLVGIDPALAPFGVLAVWTMLGVLIAAIYPLREAAQQAWMHFAQAQDNLEVARTRNAELDRVLAELLYANRQLNLLNERVSALRAVAEEAQRTKAAFVAKVSHEFRTPLNMIIGLTDLLVETPDVYGESLPPALLEDLHIVHRNCDHLAAMINDVLDLSQTEAGRLTLHKDWANLVEDIELAVDAVRPLAEKKGLRLCIDLPATLPAVYCDRTRIRQVLLNLVSNAARYTIMGAITVHAHCEQRQVTVSVADTGPGIPPEDKERIFEPFYQGIHASGRAHEGSGLGLSISKQLVERHDGRLWLESAGGVGTTFFMRLPVGPPAALVMRPEGWIHEEWRWLQRDERPVIPVLPRRSRIILYDATGGLHGVSEALAEEVEIVEVTTPTDVPDALANSPAHALLLNDATLDALLPLLDQLRRLAPDTPLFGCLLPSPVDHALAAGALDYLIKPITRADLRAALAMVNRPVRRLLLVDDDADVRQLLARLLHSDDPQLQITLAADSQAALAALRTQPIDLVLLDIMLGSETGWELLTQLRQEPTLHDVPVIIISAQDPTDQPVNSRLLVATIGEGVPTEKLMRGVQALSTILLAPV